MPERFDVVMHRERNRRQSEVTLPFTRSSTPQASTSAQPVGIKSVKQNRASQQRAKTPKDSGIHTEDHQLHLGIELLSPEQVATHTRTLASAYTGAGSARNMVFDRERAQDCITGSERT